MPKLMPTLAHCLQAHISAPIPLWAVFPHICSNIFGVVFPRLYSLFFWAVFPLQLLEAIYLDCKIPLTSLQVDGGMTGNSLLMQLQADIVGIPVGESGQADRSKGGWGRWLRWRGGGVRPVAPAGGTEMGWGRLVRWREGGVSGR